MLHAKPAIKPRSARRAEPAHLVTLSPCHLVTLSSTAAATRDPEVLLMLQVQDDEPGAFEKLVQRYWMRIFGHFYRRLGDRQEAEDLAQDVFLRLYRYRKRYQPRAKFATWLYHITQNVARNALRSRRRRPCVPLGERMSELGEGSLGERFVADRAEPPSRPMERAELAGVVRAAVSGLAGRQRTALELHQFQDRTYAQIAEQLDITPKATKSLLYRARNQLRASLTGLVEVGV
jgi:RNA polymerase sigma-70 factor, ECF subfamily